MSGRAGLPRPAVGTVNRSYWDIGGEKPPAHTTRRKLALF